MLLDLFLSLPFCRCVDILKAWTQHRMVQLAKIWARGLFIFIMLVLEKLWKRVWLCSHMVCFFYWVRVGGICVNPCVSLSSGILLCLSYSSQITEARASAESSWWAPVHCRQANMAGICDVTGQGQKPTGGWLWYRAALCVLAHQIGSQKQMYFFPDIIIANVWVCIKEQQIVIFSQFLHISTLLS